MSSDVADGNRARLRGGRPHGEGEAIAERRSIVVVVVAIEFRKKIDLIKLLLLSHLGFLNGPTLLAYSTTGSPSS